MLFIRASFSPVPSLITSLHVCPVLSPPPLSWLPLSLSPLPLSPRLPFSLFSSSSLLLLLLFLSSVAISEKMRKKNIFLLSPFLLLVYFLYFLYETLSSFQSLLLLLFQSLRFVEDGCSRPQTRKFFLIVLISHTLVLAFCVIHIFHVSDLTEGEFHNMICRSSSYIWCRALCSLYQLQSLVLMPLFSPFLCPHFLLLYVLPRSFGSFRSSQQYFLRLATTL